MPRFRNPTRDQIAKMVSGGRRNNGGDLVSRNDHELIRAFEELFQTANSNAEAIRALSTTTTELTATVNALIELTGVPMNSTDLGEFEDTDIIADDVNIKTALEQLEARIEMEHP